MAIAALSAALVAPVSLPTPPPVPITSATERFNAVMNAPELAVPGDGVQQAALLQAALAVSGDTAPTTLGGQILAGLQGSAAEVSQDWLRITEALDRLSVSPNVADTLRLQAELVQFSVESGLVTNALSSATKNIDTLVRMS